MGGPAPIVTVGAARLWAAGAAVVAATTTLAWALAQPALSPAMTAVRAIADGAAVLTLGLAVLPRLDEPRYRDELARRGTVPMMAAAGVWLVAELVRLTLSAAAAAAEPVGRLSLRTTMEFATGTSPGRAGLLAAGSAALACLLVAATRRNPPLRVPVAGLAACGIAAHAVTGHLSANTLGAVALAGHALAAALWCGTLAALALTVTARGQWARLLPAFSQLSVVCVLVLLVGGGAAALVTVHSPSDLLTTGYGRVLLAKVVVTAALLLLAWRNRADWLPAARAHRISAARSRSRSVAELTLMGVALTLAAALTVTG
jgi:copper resistance protein D